MATDHDVLRDAARHSTAILEYWFSTLDDAARLDRSAEPFQSCYRRWYGKDPSTDGEIRARFEPLLLEVTLAAIREHEHDETLSTVRRLFLCVPLMHVEDLTIQQLMLNRFDGLVERARARSPHNQGFFEFARDYARRHLDVVARFGRFPHRNAILKRESTPAEVAHLVDDPGF